MLPIHAVEQPISALFEPITGKTFSLFPTIEP